MYISIYCSHIDSCFIVELQMVIVVRNVVLARRRRQIVFLVQGVLKCNGVVAYERQYST